MIEGEPNPAGVAADTAALKIFINYRRDDAAAHARLIYDRLAGRFGPENVFLDVVSLKAGMPWLDEIRNRSSGANIFLALIGRRWAELMSERAGDDEDYVRTEIEAALHASSMEVIPTLLDDTGMPTEQRVPYSLRPLLRLHATAVRLTDLDSNIEELTQRLEAFGAAPREQPDLSVTPVQPRKPNRPSDIARAPDDDHYDEVVRLMLDEASLVVPFLGPGTNSSDRDERWSDIECGYLPDSDELAAFLGRKLELAGDPVDLAQASQYVWELRPGDLYGTLRKSLMTQSQPGSVQRFLAAFPKTLEKLGLEPRYQLIVTTNYDDALERAFDDVNEPYDLAVYMAPRSDLHEGSDAASHRGKFIHVPHDSESKVVDRPNEYGDFPFNKFTFGLERTVIVKIHGAVDTATWRNNYVITEDDYIDYLSHSAIESIVPQQIRVKLTESQFLFLGYTMRDWNLRVFLQRMFGHRLPNNSWAIQRDPNRFDARFWRNMAVDLFGVPLAQYADELAARLAAEPPAE